MTSTLSLHELPTRLPSMARGFRVVGFDVFNTLMRRSVEGEWIKRASAHALRQRLATMLHRDHLPSAAQVLLRRQELERELVAERVARGEDNEVDFTELVPRWVGTWVPRGNQTLVELCEEDEVRLEERALSAMPGVAQTLATLKDAGHRLIFVSDMYLRAHHLWRFLKGVGLARFFDAGYVSNDAGLRKATGRLFPWVLESEAISRNELLFVGDDIEADVVQPKRHGIKAVLIADAPELARRGRLQALERLSKAQTTWCEAFVHELMPEAHDSDRPEHIHEALGRTLAPGLVAFVMETVELARLEGARRIFFLAREGLTFLRIYARLRRAGVFGHEDVPEARYLFVSRASTILPSMRSLSWSELSRFWRQYPNQSLRRLLKNLGLNESPFVEKGAELGLTDADRPLGPPDQDLPFAAFLASRDVHAAFLAARDVSRSALRTYLGQTGLWGEQRVVLADIGWKGSMQDNLARAFEAETGAPELVGHYVGLAQRGEATGRSRKVGFLADCQRPDLDEVDLFRNTAIYEMATQASHGTTRRYGPHPHVQGRVVPVLELHEVERENTAQYFRHAQRGIDEWTRQFCDVFPLAPFSGKELRPGALARALNYIRYPTRAQADAFLRYSHVESFGVDHISRFGFDVTFAELLGRTPRATVHELQRRFEHTMWREGVVRRSGVPLGTFLWDLWVTLQRVR